MKKTLSMIMALCMILSLCFFSASAAEATVGAVAADYVPEGIAITDAAGFASMTADGKYYLANDINIDATWNAGAAVSATYKENTAFTGTLDGNGKTITTSAALFANLQGTVKNLTVAGAIDAGTLHGANVAMWSNGALTVENVCTKATITNANTSGGILGYGATGTILTAINCRNDADITCTNQVGGIVGYVQDYTVVITDCVNYGTISTANYGAGIIGRFGRDAAGAPKSLATITGCANYGSVTSVKGQTAGILGYLVGEAIIKDCANYGEITNNALTSAGIFGAHGNVENCALTIDGCVNYGKIVSPGIAGGIAGRVGRKASHSERNYFISNCANYGEIVVTAFDGFADIMYVGGIAGYVYGGSINGITNSVNAGNITVDSTKGADASKDYCVGGILGYVNSSTFTCQNNVNAANITTIGTFDYVCLTVYNRNVDATATKNNYSVAIDGIAVAYTGNASSDPSTLAEAPAFATAVSAEQIANGTVAGLINEAAGETIYYQAIGTDKVPTLTAAADGSNAIIKNADGSFSNPAKEEPTIPETPKTGDSALIFAVVALIAVFGVATVAKRREN